MAARFDEQSLTHEVRETHCADVVLVDHHARARTSDESQKAQADGAAGSGREVIVHDAEVAVVVEETDGGASDKGTVGYAVVVNGRHVGVEENDAPAVHVELICGDVEAV